MVSSWKSPVGVVWRVEAHQRTSSFPWAGIPGAGKIKPLGARRVRADKGVAFVRATFGGGGPRRADVFAPTGRAAGRRIAGSRSVAVQARAPSQISTKRPGPGVGSRRLAEPREAEGMKLGMVGGQVLLPACRAWQALIWDERRPAGGKTSRPAGMRYGSGGRGGTAAQPNGWRPSIAVTNRTGQAQPGFSGGGTSRQARPAPTPGAITAVPPPRPSTGRAQAAARLAQQPVAANGATRRPQGDPGRGGPQRRGEPPARPEGGPPARGDPLHAGAAVLQGTQGWPSRHVTNGRGRKVAPGARLRPPRGQCG